MSDDTQLLVQAIVENAALLGLKWKLRPGAVITLDTTQASAQIILDGDDTPMSAINVIGPINVSARVMCLIIPHEAVYIIGRLGNYGIGYLYNQTVEFVSAGTSTFTKSDYVGLRAIRAKCVGGGGGSGGCATTAAAQGATSGGGAGGTYAETWILAEDLADSTTVSIGAGGTAGTAGANSGGNGNNSSFGTACVASGGVGSGGASASGTTTGSAGATADTTGSVGDLIISGQDGSDGRHLATGERINDAVGGSSGLSFGAGRSESNTTASAAGLPGYKYGGGASGAHNQASQTQVAGAAGGDGIVIVEVYV
jgi:hypothetical protein